MSRKASDEATLRFYAAEAPAYAKAGRDQEHSHLQGFLALLPPGGRVLELGCGAGRDAEAMLARGFDVEPTDGVPEMAREAEARLGRTVRVIRFDELDADGEFDGVWAHASLLHVPWAGLPSILECIHRALKPGGVHFADYKCGDGEGRDGLGRYYNYPSPEALRSLYLDNAPWELIAVESGMGGGYDGKTTPWTSIMVRKR